MEAPCHSTDCNGILSTGLHRTVPAFYCLSDRRQQFGRSKVKQSLQSKLWLRLKNETNGMEEPLCAKLCSKLQLSLNFKDLYLHMYNKLVTRFCNVVRLVSIYVYHEEFLATCALCRSHEHQYGSRRVLVGSNGEGVEHLTYYFGMDKIHTK